MWVIRCLRFRPGPAHPVTAPGPRARRPSGLIAWLGLRRDKAAERPLEAGGGAGAVRWPRVWPPSQAKGRGPGSRPRLRYKVCVAPSVYLPFILVFGFCSVSSVLEE